MIKKFLRYFYNTILVLLLVTTISCTVIGLILKNDNYGFYVILALFSAIGLIPNFFELPKKVKSLDWNEYKEFYGINSENPKIHNLEAGWRAVINYLFVIYGKFFLLPGIYSMQIILLAIIFDDLGWSPVKVFSTIGYIVGTYAVLIQLSNYLNSENKISEKRKKLPFSVN